MSAVERARKGRYDAAANRRMAQRRDYWQTEIRKPGAKRAGAVVDNQRDSIVRAREILANDDEPSIGPCSGWYSATLTGILSIPERVGRGVRVRCSQE